MDYGYDGWIEREREDALSAQRATRNATRSTQDAKATLLLSLYYKQTKHK